MVEGDSGPGMAVLQHLCGLVETTATLVQYDDHNVRSACNHHMVASYIPLHIYISYYVHCNNTCRDNLMNEWYTIFACVHMHAFWHIKLLLKKKKL